MPAPTPLAEKLVAALPVEKFARLLNPGADPAWMMNEVGAQPTGGACHVSVTVDPFTAVASPVGTAGGMLQRPVVTVTTISFDGALVPLAFWASTRTK